MLRQIIPNPPEKTLLVSAAMLIKMIEHCLAMNYWHFTFRAEHINSYNNDN